MRELERDLSPHEATPSAPAAPRSLVVIGNGRAGGALARAAARAGIEVERPARGAAPAQDAPDAVLLCVPDAAIAEACAVLAGSLAPGTPVGHVSGATPLSALAAAAEAGLPVFSLHPLQTIPDPQTDLAGSSCAIAGSDPATLEVARALALALGMRPFAVPEDARAAYHAAAAIASNFLIALEESAAELLERAGVTDARAVLAPLVLRTAANWADEGAAALTGPIARGDEATVAAHIEAIAATHPDLEPLYAELAKLTREIARRREDPR